ncbi:MAG: DegQ family serine endoprotease [Gammaproteobacteria bacterium]
MKPHSTFRLSRSLLLLLGLSLVTPLNAALPVAVGGQELPTLAPMLDKATPAVINIASRGHVAVEQNPLLADPFFRRFFNVPDQPRERQTESLGSGVIVDAAHGYVLTNNHVIDKADEITVTLRDGRHFNAKLIGADPESDVAVVQIPAQKLVALPLADSAGVRVGDFVVAIGNPFGLGQTVTSGIVSALGRSGLGIEGYEDFIQTDASINPGNSGGALVNLRGELVGINTAILAPNGGNIGIGFAIPINMAREIMGQLIAHGEVRRGQLGVTAQDLTPDLAKAFNIQAESGTVVAEVAPGSPAATAGLKAGDVIMSVNDRPVRSSAAVRNIIGMMRIGQQVKMEILRDGNTKKVITATIAEPHTTVLDGKQLQPRLAGALYANIDEGSPLYGRVTGVLVTKVRPGGPAWRAGLRPSDVITSLNRQPVSDVRTLQRIAAASPGRLLMNVQRGESALFILIQ